MIFNFLNYQKRKEMDVRDDANLVGPTYRESAFLSLSVGGVIFRNSKYTNKIKMEENRKNEASGCVLSRNGALPGACFWGFSST